MASLRDLLYPLPLEALSALAVSWDASDPREASLRARTFLLEANLMDDTITTVHIQNVFDKLLAAAPHLLPTSCPVTLPKVPCLTAVCGACSQPLATHQMLSARMLTFQRGLVPVLVEEKGCPTCGLVFNGCWVLPPTGGLRLAACPSPKDPFLIQPVREPRSIAAVELQLLHLCSSLVVRLHGSFAGIVKVLGDMSGSPLSQPLRNELFHAWLGWMSVTLLSPTRHFVALQEPAFFVSHHRGPCRSQWLAAVLPLLQQRHWDLYIREHSCETCRRGCSIGFDVKVGFSAALCAVRAGGDLSFPFVRQTVHHGCTNRPAFGSKFCWDHQHFASVDAKPMTCPDEHPLQHFTEDLVWHHVCDVCTSPLPSPSSFWSCPNAACNFDVCEAWLLFSFWLVVLLIFIFFLGLRRLCRTVTQKHWPRLLRPRRSCRRTHPLIL